MAKEKCKPLKITAHLVDGRINSADGIIMFDSILYHAWFIRNAPHVLDGNGYDDWSGYIGLPLVQLPGNRYAASKGIYECVEQSIEHYNKRPDFFAPDKIGYLDMEKGLISDSVGLFRAYRNPQVIRIVKDSVITFYAVGHADDVKSLLDLIPAVGKKNSMGWGFVDRWEVVEIDEDFSLWHPDYGLMRPLPVEESKEKLQYPIMRYAVRPPYWKPKNQKLCYVPIGGRQ